MILNLYTAPAIEPVSMADAKLHLRLDSGTLAGNVALSTCIPAGSHPVVTGYTLFGTAVDVLGKQALVYLQPVNNGTGGTVDVKIQESDDNITFADWKIDAVVQEFTRVTEVTDTVVQEKAYTGSKRYIRTAAKTLVAPCEFGTSILVNAATTPEDTLISDWITTARIAVENDTRRQLITATWDYYPQSWPCGNRLKIPLGNLQSVTAVKYKDTDGTETTLTEGTDYLVELNGDKCGALVLPYGGSWPSTTLYPSNPISIRFVCGYGDDAADVPTPARVAMCLRIAKLYFSRGDDRPGVITEDKGYAGMINAVPRLYDEDFL